MYVLLVIRDALQSPPVRRIRIVLATHGTNGYASSLPTGDIAQNILRHSNKKISTPLIMGVILAKYQPRYIRKLSFTQRTHRYIQPAYFF